VPSSDGRNRGKEKGERRKEKGGRKKEEGGAVGSRQKAVGCAADERGRGAGLGRDGGLAVQPLDMKWGDGWASRRLPLPV